MCAQNYSRVTGGVVRANSMAPVGRVVRVLVTVEETVKDGDPVYVRYASGSGGSQLGSFRTSADSSTAALLPNACYRSDASAAGLAVCEINLPG
jgi:hypothetical protein